MQTNGDKTSKTEKGSIKKLDKDILLLLESEVHQTDEKLDHIYAKNIAPVLVLTQAFAPKVGEVEASEIPPTSTAPAAKPIPTLTAVFLKNFMSRECLSFLKNSRTPAQKKDKNRLNRPKSHLDDVCAIDLYIDLWQRADGFS